MESYAHLSCLFLFCDTMWGAPLGVEDLTLPDGFKITIDRQYLEEADVVVIHQQMLLSGKEIVTPNCLTVNTNDTFDLNTFKLKPGAEFLDWSIYTVDGIVQPPKGFGRLYLSDLQQYDLVELDGVGGTMLLVKADLHREGLVFPPVSFRGYIETEGLAVLARDMGYQCWGMPNLEIFHPNK